MQRRGTAVVTGGSRGIGAAICAALADDGLDVVIDHANDAGAQGAADVAARVVSAGRRALVVRADVADATQVEGLFARAVSWGGPVVAVVNNAGVTGPLGRVDALDPAQLHRVLAVNVAGAFYCSGAAVRHMSTAHGGVGGAIVTVSSRAAVLGSPGEFVHYAASKAALDTLTVGLAREVATEGIRVNAVAVGLVDTDLHASAGEPGRADRLRPTIPVQRSARPAEVAEAVRWLLSDAASYTTGAVLAVSGGR